MTRQTGICPQTLGSLGAARTATLPTTDDETSGFPATGPMTSASKVRIKHVLSGSSQPNSRYRLDRADGRQAHRVVEEIRPRRELDRDDLGLRIDVDHPPNTLPADTGIKEGRLTRSE